MRAETTDGGRACGLGVQVEVQAQGLRGRGWRRCDSGAALVTKVLAQLRRRVGAVARLEKKNRGRERGRKKEKNEKKERKENKEKGK